uniref:Uncharacterized protein n=1 Tax=Triticum urartu TaxID=4572 RepID=A0A8R7TL34_TRIUA
MEYMKDVALNTSTRQGVCNQEKARKILKGGDTFAAPPLHSNASTMRPTRPSRSRRCASRCRRAISMRIRCDSLAASILLSSARTNPSPIALTACTTSLSPA